MRSFMPRRAVAVVATVAISAAGLVGLASSANAASTSLKFNCSASILTNQEFTFDADLTVPAEVEVGSTIETTFNGSVSVPESTRGAAYSLLGGRFLRGVATIDGKFGAAPLTLTADLPKAPIPSASGAFALSTTGGGSVVADTVGAQDITIAGFTAPLKMENSSGAESDVNVTCTAKAPGTVVATVNVVPADVDPTPEPTPDPTVDPTPEPTPDPTVEPTPEPTPDPTVDPDPEVKPNPIKTVVTAIVALLKKLLGNLFKK